MEEGYLFSLVMLWVFLSMGFWRKEINQLETSNKKVVREWFMRKISGKMVGDLFGFVKNVLDKKIE